MLTNADSVAEIERFATLSALFADPFADRIAVLSGAGLDGPGWQSMMERCMQRLEGVGGEALARHFAEVFMKTLRSLSAPGSSPAHPASSRGPNSTERTLSAQIAPFGRDLEVPSTLPSPAHLPAPAPPPASAPCGQQSVISVVAPPSSSTRAAPPLPLVPRQSSPLARTLDVNERLPTPAADG